MTMALKNFIGGEWVDGSGVTRNINPSNTNDVVGEYAKADKAQTEKAIAAAKAAFPAWSRSTPQERYDALNKISLEILARKDELGRLLAREEGKTLPEGIGEVARAGQIFAFFAGEALRADRREGRLRASGPRCRDYPRAGRRRRPDHALEFPDRDSRLEDRARALLRQYRGVQAGRTRAGLGACAVRDHRRAPACPAGVFNLVVGSGLGRRPDPARTPRRRRDLLHRLGRDRPQASRRPACVGRR